MEINLAWIKDPKTGVASVSLTNFCIATLFLLVAGGLNLAGITKDTSLAVEYFGISSALYFGRAMSINGKDYNSTSNNEETQENSKKEKK